MLIVYLLVDLQLHSLLYYIEMLGLSQVSEGEGSSMRLPLFSVYHHTLSSRIHYIA